MANENLKGLKVSILIEDGFDQVEMVEPRRSLDQAGAVTHIVSPRNKEVVVDGALVTSRKPDDIPAFNREMIALFGRERRRSRQTA